MKLTKVRVQNFRSIEDSEEFTLEDLTCLVGKNEAGKSALLAALHGLNPYQGFEYDKIRDYPRRYLTKFDQRHPDGKSEVVTSWWELSDADVAAVEEELGGGFLKTRQIEVSHGIGYSNALWKVQTDDEVAVRNAVEPMRLNASESGQIAGLKTTQDIVAKLTKTPPESAKLLQLKERLGKYSKTGNAHIFAVKTLAKRMPAFFLSSHFDRMSGEVSLNKLAKDKSASRISVGDKIFMDFIEYAGTTIEELRDATKAEELKSRCEGASNDITDEMFEFWSQNDALEVEIAIEAGKPDDAPPFNEGMVARVRIKNRHHRASVPLTERSAGFVWFFSFLAQFKQLSKKTGNVILLLDEPGLTLHGKAQADLLRYIQERLLEDHQVIYTTHSPFLVPANQLSKVRVVEDVVRNRASRNQEILGTKVSAEVLSVDGDTLFPLLGHLGYELTQSLFIGKNTLLVEGPSDILYIQATSAALKKRGRVSLDDRWVICPTGGIDKMQSFASLFSGNKLNIATLTDYGLGDRKKVERLRESEILAANQIYTTTDFTAKQESDVEDFFEPELFAEIVSSAFGLRASDVLTAQKLEEADTSCRLVKKAEAAFRLLASYPDFDHFTPSYYLLKNEGHLEGETGPVMATLDRFERLFVTLNKLL